MLLFAILLRPEQVKRNRVDGILIAKFNNIKIRYLIKLFPVGASMLVSGCCDDEVFTVPEGENAEMTVCADIATARTRTVADDSFDTNDAIGVFLLDNNTNSPLSTGDMAKYSNCKYIYDGTSFKGADITNTVYFGDESVYRVAAYYPFNVSGTSFSIDTSVSGGSLTQTQENQNKNLDILVSNSVQTGKSALNVEFKGDNAFRHVMSKLVLVFSAGEDGGFSDSDEINDILENMKFEMTGLHFKGTVDMGKYPKDGVFGIFTLTDKGSIVIDDTQTGVNSEFSDNQKRITLLLIPQTSDATIGISYTESDGTAVSFKSQPFTLNLDSGREYVLPVTITKKVFR